MAIIIDDFAFALLEIIQLGITSAAIAGEAMGFQVVAVNASFIAGLRIRSYRQAA